MKVTMDYPMVLAMVTALLMMVGIISVFFLGNDNAVEETCEKGVEILSGNKIDLSPNSPEDVVSQ